MPLKTFLIVDGYNIIHAWPELEDLTAVSLESARVKLMDILSNYQGMTDETVIVVFDGYLVKGSEGSVSEEVAVAPARAAAVWPPNHRHSP